MPDHVPPTPGDLHVTYLGPDPLGGIAIQIDYCEPDTDQSIRRATYRLEVGARLELCHHLFVKWVP